MGLQSNGDVTLEEQVAMFMQCLGQAHNLRTIGEDFQHSLETDAIGAIDGTHIKAYVDQKDEFKERFINRKGEATQNVMAAVDFDENFVGVVAGWEGSAHDNIILRSAVEEGFLRVPHGKYYLVDAGYANTPQFLAPYRRVSYHMASFRDRARARGGYQYDNAEELFNHRHAQLRNVVKRTFGIVKNRFHILNDMLRFDFKTQVKIVAACCTLHNFIKHHNRLRNVSDDNIFEVPQFNQGSQVGGNGDTEDPQNGEDENIDSQAEVNLCESIKNTLWQMRQSA
ncbi:hypothetical protein LUZ61_000142 [Rhynchospora tenuis]|uniref:DDE Tnp4 domain-containing protein n=1 Tax=Rhynchospora tenuis TaxID=198213 RepID=A0AAD5ZEK6_9POAL|nr:hypothetical protein LUZ61_000142 [Rhynchospora tenuis]